MEPLFKVTIPGRCYVKKNTAKVFGRRKINTPQFQNWERVAYSHMIKARQNRIPFNFPLHAEIKFYFKNRAGEADLSNLFEGPCDVLKLAGVITDDKLIDSFDQSRRIYGDPNPRTEISLYRFET